MNGRSEGKISIINLNIDDNLQAANIVSVVYIFSVHSGLYNRLSILATLLRWEVNLMSMAIGNSLRCGRNISTSIYTDRYECMKSYKYEK